MTQALSHSPLHLQLTPMRVPEAVPAEAMVRSGLATASAPAGLQLLLRPGEPSEMIVQLRNTGNHTIRCHLQPEGNFPAAWCRVGGMESQEIAPGRQLDAVLLFQIPTDFFENQQTIHPEQPLLLDYECRLLVYYTIVNHQPAPSSPSTLTVSGSGLEQAAFKLQVRPHSLYLKFLPTLYREVDFLERFLKIFEQAFEPAVHTLNTMWAHLDPLTAPQAMLPFLAYWVAFPVDPRWSVERQRRLIRNAMELYRWRGTRRGLRLYLHLYTDLPLDDHLSHERDKHIAITELFSDGLVLADSQIGQTAMIGGGCPFHFIVRLREDHPDQIDESLVRYIIDQEKPAFCTYELYIESPTST
jgi:phage tail-like protein